MIENNKDLETLLKNKNHKYKDDLCEDYEHEYNEKGSCKHCGLVNPEANLTNQERRAYSKEEVEKTKRTEKKWNICGPRTIIPTKTDYQKKQIHKKGLFNRLSKIQKSLITSIERNFWEAIPKMRKMRKHYPEQILKTAWAVYAESAKRKLTMGRSIDGFIAGSLYAAIRIHGWPRLMFDIINTLEDEIDEFSSKPYGSNNQNNNSNKKIMRQTLSVIIKNEILPCLEKRLKEKGMRVDYSFKNVKYIDYLNTYAGRIGFPPYIIKKIAGFAQTFLNNEGYIKESFDPAGIIAANLYVGFKELIEKKLSYYKKRLRKINWKRRNIHFCIPYYDLFINYYEQRIKHYEEKIKDLDIVKKNILKKTNYEIKKRRPNSNKTYDKLTQGACSLIMGVTEATLRERIKDTKKKQEEK